MAWHPKNPVVQPDGTQLWYRFRQTHTGFTFALHRTDGPAIIYPDGSAEWWVDGEFVAAEEEMMAALERAGVDMNELARLSYYDRFVVERDDLD